MSAIYRSVVARLAFRSRHQWYYLHLLSLAIRCCTMQTNRVVYFPAMARQIHNRQAVADGVLNCHQSRAALLRTAKYKLKTDSISLYESEHRFLVRRSLEGARMSNAGGDAMSSEKASPKTRLGTCSFPIRYLCSSWWGS
jgi:hypothetical protein